MKRPIGMALLLAVALLLLPTACGAPSPPESFDDGNAEESAEAQSGAEAARANSAQEDRPPDPPREAEPEEDPPPAPEPASASETSLQAEGEAQPAAEPIAEDRGDGMIAVRLTVGAESFSALFYDNEAARALLAQMPLTLTMSDLNRNEKYYHFPSDLHAIPTERPDTIRAGEIMVWSGNCLVLFYETFSNTYGGYVKVGALEDIDGLAEALGTDSVAVTFSAA